MLLNLFFPFYFHCFPQQPFLPPHFNCSAKCPSSLGVKRNTDGCSIPRGNCSGRNFAGLELGFVQLHQLVSLANEFVHLEAITSKHVSRDNPQAGRDSAVLYPITADPGSNSQAQLIYREDNWKLHEPECHSGRMAKGGNFLFLSWMIYIFNSAQIL